MTAKSLSKVTQNLITSYGHTARNVVDAYRQGNARAVSFVDQTWANALDKVGPRVSEEVRRNATSAQQTLCNYYTRGITLSSQGADTVVERAVDLAQRGVHQVAANANRFEQATGFGALSALAEAAVPAAASVYQWAQRVEARSAALVDKVAAAPKASQRRASTRKASAAKRPSAKAATSRPAVRKAAGSRKPA